MANHTARTSSIPKEQRFFLVLRVTGQESYVEFFDREVWGFEPSMYVAGTTREDFLRELRCYYGDCLHPEEHRYILELVMQIPWSRVHGAN